MHIPRTPTQDGRSNVNAPSGPTAIRDSAGRGTGNAMLSGLLVKGPSLMGAHVTGHGTDGRGALVGETLAVFWARRGL